VELGALDTPGIASYDVEVVGGVAYVADGWSGLRIVDVSDLAAPVELGALDTPYHADNVEVAGDLAYIAGGSRLHVIDVSDPSAPVEIGSLGTAGAGRVQVADDLAYVAAGGFGLRIIDVSDPTLPVELGALDTPGNAADVEVMGNLAYVVTYLYDGYGYFVGLKIFDVSDPFAPVELGAVATPGLAWHVEVVGNLAYVTGDGLRIIDVSDPQSPVALGGALAPAENIGAVVGDLAYVAAGRSGLLIVDVSNPAFPAMLGALEVPDSSYALAVEVVGDRAYVLEQSYYGGAASLNVIDVSDPTAPAELGSLAALDILEDLEVAGDIAYLYGVNGVQIVDVSDPSAPVELLAGVGGRRWLSDIEVAGDRVYVAGIFYKLDFGSRIFLGISDASDPAHPQLLGELVLCDADYNEVCEDVSVAAVGDLVYVTYRYDGYGYFVGLKIFDVSDPSAPVELGAIDTPEIAYEVEVVDHLAYVADRSGLRIIDVSNPAAPVELGALEMPGWASAYLDYEVAVTGDRAYLADGDALHAIDVSDPAHPVALGGFPIFGISVDVEGGLAYVVDGLSLSIIDFGPEYAPSIEVDLDIKPGSDTNRINLGAGGVIPAAILGSDQFEVALVDAATLAFGPGAATPDHRHGPHVQDVNADGIMDLVVHFRTEATGIEFGDRTACLSGKMLDGRRFEGCDSVRTVPNMGDAPIRPSTRSTLEAGGHSQSTSLICGRGERGVCGIGRAGRALASHQPANKRFHRPAFTKQRYASHRNEA